MRENGVNYFKWDNATSFVSLAAIARELRKLDPNLFINTTVNTFPSPFFLNSMDATWRGGDDCGWFGPGDSRERYITYRDKELYARVVRKAPLYPISSIMHCAPVVGRWYQAKDIVNVDLRHDCRGAVRHGADSPGTLYQPGTDAGRLVGPACRGDPLGARQRRRAARRPLDRRRSGQAGDLWLCGVVAAEGNPHAPQPGGQERGGDAGYRPGLRVASLRRTASTS